MNQLRIHEKTTLWVDTVVVWAPHCLAGTCALLKKNAYFQKQGGPIRSIASRGQLCFLKKIILLTPKFHPTPTPDNQTLPIPTPRSNPMTPVTRLGVTIIFPAWPTFSSNPNLKHSKKVDNRLDGSHGMPWHMPWHASACLGMHGMRWHALACLGMPWHAIAC